MRIVAGRFANGKNREFVDRFSLSRDTTSTGIEPVRKFSSGGRVRAVPITKAAAARQGARPLRKPQAQRGNGKSTDLKEMLWRLERLERQIRRLSELVREHAVDADRLVQIVAEDRDILRRQLLGRGGVAARNKKAPPLHARYGIAST